MKWVKAMAALLAAVLLSGCRWIPITDLSDRAIVQGVGVDWADGEYVVTMQVFSPEGSGGQTIVDPRTYTDRPRNADFALDADRDLFARWMMACIRRFEG